MTPLAFAGRGRLFCASCSELAASGKVHVDHQSMLLSLYGPLPLLACVWPASLVAGLDFGRIKVDCSLSAARDTTICSTSVQSSTSSQNWGTQILTQRVCGLQGVKGSWVHSQRGLCRNDHVMLIFEFPSFDLMYLTTHLLQKACPQPPIHTDS